MIKIEKHKKRENTYKIYFKPQKASFWPYHTIEQDVVFVLQSSELKELKEALNKLDI